MQSIKVGSGVKIFYQKEYLWIKYAFFQECDTGEMSVSRIMGVGRL